MFPLQVFEEGETSKTFKAGGAKSFEGGRGEEVGGGAGRSKGASGPGSSLGQQLPH